MNRLEKTCSCFWKISCNTEKKKGELADSFDKCKACEGYDNTCKNYFNTDYSLLSRKTRQIEQ